MPVFYIGEELKEAQRCFGKAYYLTRVDVKTPSRSSDGT